MAIIAYILYFWRCYAKLFSFVASLCTVNQISLVRVQSSVSATYLFKQAKFGVDGDLLDQNRSDDIC